MRPIQTYHRPPNKQSQSGVVRNIVLFGLFFIVLLVVFNVYRSVSGHTNPTEPEITSTIEGYCLDDHHNGSGVNAVVDAWKCNGSAAQNWSMSGSVIKHDDHGCLGVKNNGTSAGDGVVVNACNNSKGQVWSIDLGGFENPNSGLCLSVPHSKTDIQLTVESCNNLAQLNQGWEAVHWNGNTSVGSDCNMGSEGQKVACYAEKQWLAWQSGAPSHATLLNDYTDGNAYEEWCADFVSYVYREAGYPFTNGERNNWDEYDANNIQNMGFTMHAAGNYTPKPGDVAFFDYPGGHVEIVVAGGKTPTYIYGDSGTTDPSTNNGEMNEDMLSSDGSVGQVVYYLSPQ